jgi:hypothetical protein
LEGDFDVIELAFPDDRWIFVTVTSPVRDSSLHYGWKKKNCVGITRTYFEMEEAKTIRLSNGDR